MMLRTVLLVIVILSVCPSTVDTPSDNPYGVGGSGAYADYLGIAWFREWDHYHRPVSPNPVHRFWTVGKLDNRLGGCMPGTLSGSKENIDSVFACDVQVITEIVNEGYTGQVWEIGNEPNWYPYVTPENYAYQFQLYHEFITDLDSTAKLMNGGISLYPGSWVNWLDGFLVYYNGSPPIDVWNIHPYDTFDTQAGARTISKIVSFHNWLNDIDPGGTIWITEFGKGNWYPESEQNIVRYIEIVCGWLNEHAGEHEIERWFWWGILAGYQGMGANGLFSAGPYGRDTVTLAGDAYITASGRVFVDHPGYERDDTRTLGTMRNPYNTLDEAMSHSSPGMIIYDFQTGAETTVPIPTPVLPVGGRSYWRGVDFGLRQWRR
jgi:hypothetical protein